MIEAAAVAAMVANAAGLDGDGEALKSRDLAVDLLRHTPDPFSRAQFVPGHITGSGLVLAPDGARVLLIHHKRLDRWLLPGGHVEADDPEIAEAARREVVEETAAELSAEMPWLVGVDVHGIPPKRGEPYHLHHDLVFGFQALSEALAVSDESHAALWCGPADFDRYAVPGNVRRAWARALRR